MGAKYVSSHITPGGRVSLTCSEHGRLALGGRPSEVAMQAATHEALHRQIPGHVMGKVWRHRTDDASWYECECGATGDRLATNDEAWEALRKHQSEIREANRAKGIV